MAQRSNGFPSFAEKSSDPGLWAKYFLSFDPSQWETEGDGVLSYESDDGLLFSLAISYWPDVGFLLDYSCRETATARFVGDNYYPISASESLGEFVELDDLMYPRGCFLDPQMAWLAVEDFLIDATKRSRRIDWIPSSEVSWPEDLF